MSQTAQRKIAVGFEADTIDQIQAVAGDLQLSLAETIVTLTSIGLDYLANDFDANQTKVDADRRLTLISDIFDLSRTERGAMSPEDLDLLDENISERIAAEMNFTTEQKEPQCPSPQPTPSTCSNDWTARWNSPRAGNTAR